MSGPATRGAYRYTPAAYPTWLLDEDQPDPACKGIPLAVFFPEHGGSAAAAKAICRRCPRKDRCREWALAQPVTDLHGTWGGMSAYDRQQEIKRRKAAARTTTTA